MAANGWRPRLPWILCVGLFAQVARAQLSTIDAQAEEAQRIRSNVRASARFDLEGNVVENQWCLPDPEGNCRWGAYVSSIAAASLSSFLLFAIFATIASCCCCNPHQLVFRWKPSPGMPCCPGEELLFRGYRQSQVNTARVALLAALILVLLFSLSGWGGRPLIDEGIVSIHGEVRRASSYVRTTGEAIATTLAAHLQDQAGRSPVPFTIAIDEASAFRDALRLSVNLFRVQAAFAALNTMRRVLLDSALVMPVVTVFCGLVAALLNLGPTVGAWGVLTCVAMILVWLALLLHAPLIPLLADLCDHMDQVIKKEEVSNTDSYTGCAARSTFASVDGILTAVEQLSANIVCSGLTAVELAGDADVSNFTSCSPDTFDKTRKRLSLGGCTEEVDAGNGTTTTRQLSLPRCAALCPQSNLTESCNPFEPPGQPLMATGGCGSPCRAAVIVEAMDFHDTYTQLSARLQPLHDCDFVLDTYRRMYEPACVKVIVGLNAATTAATTMGVCLAVAMFFMTPFCKLFRKQNQAMYRRYGLHTDQYVRAKRSEAQADAADITVLGRLRSGRNRAGRFGPREDGVASAVDGDASLYPQAAAAGDDGGYEYADSDSLPGGAGTGRSVADPAAPQASQLPGSTGGRAAGGAGAGGKGGAFGFGVGV